MSVCPVIGMKDYCQVIVIVPEDEDAYSEGLNTQTIAVGEEEG